MKFTWKMTDKIGLLEGIDCKEVDANEGHIF